MDELLIIKWIAENAHPRPTMEGTKWVLYKDSDEAWDGVDDDRIPVYTHEKLLEYYKNNPNAIRP